VAEEVIPGGVNLTTTTKLYGNFSEILNGRASFHYLMDFPKPGEQFDFLPVNLSAPLLTTAGSVSFGLLDSDGELVEEVLPNLLDVESTNDLSSFVDDNFAGLEIQFDGLARVGLQEFAAIEIHGNSKLRIMRTEASPFPSMTLALDGNLSVVGLIDAELVTAQGFFALEFITSPPLVNVWGALSIEASADQLPFLDSAGIDLGGNVLLMMNSTNVEKVEGIDFPEVENDTPDEAQDDSPLVIPAVMARETLPPKEAMHG
jgi:hypothetical protein